VVCSVAQPKGTLATASAISRRRAAVRRQRKDRGQREHDGRQRQQDDERDALILDACTPAQAVG
jgi:hypothetical protein